MRWRSPRTAALVVSVLLVGYFVVLGTRAVALIAAGGIVPVSLGLAILVLPVLGALLVWDQLRFGARTEYLARKLDAEGALPEVDHLPRRPSGRVERAAADAWFDEKEAELREAPRDWRAWYALAQAYDLAGDRNRGRKAMRRAIELERGTGDA